MERYAAEKPAHARLAELGNRLLDLRAHLKAELNEGDALLAADLT